MRHGAVDHVFIEKGRRGCGPGCQLVMQECPCGLERRLRVLDGQVRTVEVKILGGHWVDVRDWLSTELPYMLCPRCSGSGCDTCRGLGVLERIKPRATAGGKT
jgi:hypothetical protein